MTGEFFAQAAQRTFAAFWGTGNTNFPTEQHDPVAEIGAFLRGEYLSQLLLHLFRVFALGQSQLAANADAVGIADHTPRLPVQIAQQQIGGLSAHTRQLQQRLHGVRHFAAVLLQQHPAGQHDVLCFLAIKAAGMDVGLNIGYVRICQRLQGRIGGKKGRRYQIDPD